MFADVVTRCIPAFDDEPHVVARVLSDFEMAFSFNAAKNKFHVAAYYPLGYARFTLRLKPTGVELYRKRGDQDITVRVMSALSGSEVVFSSPPRPYQVSTNPPEPSPNSSRCLIDILSSPYEDVAINGCTALVKVIASSSSMTRFCSVDLMAALLGVLTGNFSIDTKSNAALALSLLSSEREAIENLQSAGALTCMLDILEAEKNHYSTMFLKRYCADVVLRICLAYPEQKTDRCVQVFQSLTKSSYTPLQVRGRALVK